MIEVARYMSHLGTPVRFHKSWNYFKLSMPYYRAAMGKESSAPRHKIFKDTQRFCEPAGNLAIAFASAERSFSSHFRLALSLVDDIFNCAATNACRRCSKGEMIRIMDTQIN